MSSERKVLLVIGLAVVGVLFWGLRHFGADGEARVQLVQGGWQEGEQIAAPLLASVRVQKRGRTAVFSLSLADSKDRAVGAVLGPDGRRPAPPKVRVLDADGKEVYHCTLSYG